MRSGRWSRCVLFSVCVFLSFPFIGSVPPSVKSLPKLNRSLKRREVVISATKTPIPGQSSHKCG